MFSGFYVYPMLVCGGGKAASKSATTPSLAFFYVLLGLTTSTRAITSCSKKGIQTRTT